MTSRKARAAVAAAFVSVVGLGAMGSAAAQDAAAVVSNPQPVRVFAQLGPGMVEFAHLEVGTFLGPHLSVEANLSWNGVFGPRYGGGVFYTFGHARGPRPPRHGLLLGARLMLDSGANFRSQGDDLSSYGVIPVGYSFLTDSGFFFRFTVGLGIVREQVRQFDPVTGTSTGVDYKVSVGGPLTTASFGFAF